MPYPRSVSHSRRALDNPLVAATETTIKCAAARFLSQIFRGHFGERQSESLE
jgi:hypothetical protein